MRPSLDHLVRVASGAQDADGAEGDNDHQTPTFPFDDDQRRLEPGKAEIGTRDGASVTIEATELSGVVFSWNEDPRRRPRTGHQPLRAGRPRRHRGPLRR